MTPLSDFSRTVVSVSPPALFPADGLLFISALLRAEFFPPVDPADQPIAYLPGHGPAREEMLGAIDFRCLREDRRSTVLNQKVGRSAEGLVRYPDRPHMRGWGLSQIQGEWAHPTNRPPSSSSIWIRMISWNERSAANPNSRARRAS